MQNPTALVAATKSDSHVQWTQYLLYFRVVLSRAAGFGGFGHLTFLLFDVWLKSLFLGTVDLSGDLFRGYNTIY